MLGSSSVAAQLAASHEGVSSMSERVKTLVPIGVRSGDCEAEKIFAPVVNQPRFSGSSDHSTVTLLCYLKFII
jgi:hypothetical protein